ncbi:MAG TPA: glycoside hydrolase family 3 protein [Ktedonobacteraceae bacterium]
MEPTSPWSSERLYSDNNEQDGTQKQPVVGHLLNSRKIDKNFIATLETIKIANIRIEAVTMDTSNSSQAKEIIEDKLTNIDVERPWVTDTQKTQGEEAEAVDALEPPQANNSTAATTPAIQDTPVPEELIQTLNSQADGMSIDMYDTGKIVITAVPSSPPLVASFNPAPAGIKRGTAILLLALLAIVALQGLTIGPNQFLGAQGWASVLGNPVTQGNPNLLTNLKKQITHPVKPGSTAIVKVQMTPDQYIDLIVNKMTLDQKLGQMMIVQFTGATYSLPISTMISQYNVGAVLVFTANGNVVDKGQLTGLIQQMKSGSTTIPLAVAIDQEGGPVDRLVNLDGPRPSADTIGATNDPNQARQAGIQTAKDLLSYGFNLNLAPVVDVTNVYNPQMDGRTFGDTPAQVTKMAGAYLQGLQKSGKVVGTLKHFPGLGDVATDPHLAIPQLTRSKSDLEAIDWAPYRALIKSGNVHAIMVTHEIVEALDTTEPSSLSPKIIQGILRKELGFQGVIMTDSLTMDALTAYATMSQAAVLSIEAGSDLLMGASSPDDVASMFQSIKQAMSSGAITQQRINESVHRILMMKYAMGLLPIPKN